MPRLIAIGDIHGCANALRTLLAAIDPQPTDTVVTLGDYVNKGPDSKGVLDLLIALSGHSQLIPILGNHDELMLQSRQGSAGLETWLHSGGFEDDGFLWHKKRDRRDPERTLPVSRIVRPVF
jgi:serine/threonine protein phosphatase 1